MKSWILFSALALVLASCHKDSREYGNPVERVFPLTGFKRVYAGGSFTVTITKGNEFSVKAKGRPADLDDLDLTNGQGGSILSIDYDHYEPNRYRVDFTITLPELNQLTLSGNSEGTVHGFGDQQSLLRSVLSGNAKLKLNGSTINLPIELSGNSSLTVSGSTLSLYGNVSGNAALHAYDVQAVEVDLNASGNAQAYVTPQENIFAAASGESRIYYKGNPSVTNFITTGNGKIIRQ